MSAPPLPPPFAPPAAVRAEGGTAGSVPRLDLRLLIPAVAAWVGAWLGVALPLWASLAACGVATLLAVHGWWRRRLALAAALVCLSVALAIGAMRVVALQAGPIDELAAARAVVTVELVVTGDPRPHAGATRGVRRARAHIVVPARVHRVSGRGQLVRVRSAVIVLAGDTSWSGLLPGQRASASGRLSPARRAQPVAAVLLVSGPPDLVGRPPAVQRVAGDLRAGLRRSVAGLPAGQRGLVPGLVLGDTAQMPEFLRSDFRTSGLTHLTAVSGANLAIVCGFVLYVGRWVGVRGRWLPVAGALSLLGFVVLARPQPSVLRAAVMGLVALAALASGRRRGGVAALAAAMLGLLLVDPWLARSFGFALSVVATASLLVLAPPWARWLHARRLPLPLAQALAVPAAASMACAPIVTLLSAGVSLVAVPANLLVAPAIAPATILGVLATVVGPVNAAVASGLGWLAGVPAWWVVTVARKAASVPFAELSWSASELGALALAGLLVGIALLARRVAARPHRLALLLAMLLVIGGAAVSTPGWPPRGWLLVVCDVGQGDALVLSAGEGRAVVVDVGPEPRAVDDCLRHLAVRDVAAVVITHLHADHVEGLPGVLRGRDVSRILVSGYAEPSGEWNRVRQWAAEADIAVERTAVGDVYRVASLSWQVLWPVRVIEGEGSVPNNASLVMLVDSGGVRMLLTGDIEPAAQNAVLARWRFGAVDVLKVAHHGSAAQQPDLLHATQPRIAVISVGAGNDYGHPAPSTLRDLLRSGAVVGRTDRDGALAVAGSVDDLRLVVAGNGAPGRSRGRRLPPDTPRLAQPPGARALWALGATGRVRTPAARARRSRRARHAPAQRVPPRQERSSTQSRRRRVP